MMLPLATPGVSAQAVITAPWSWNDRLAVGRRYVCEEHAALGRLCNFQGSVTTDYTDMMAAIVMAMAPVLTFFVAPERRTVHGLAFTGTEG